LTSPVSINDIANALDLLSPQHIALVGGGGKTSLLHAFADQLDGGVLLTCTTKMGADQTRGKQVLVAPTDAEVVDHANGGAVLVWNAIQGQRAVGVDPTDCDRWFELVDNVVVEADGARRRPFKAPKPYEPVVPSTATTMISVIGVDALGRVIADQCHRPLRVAALAGCSPYVRLSPHAAATVLFHPDGARRGLPLGARLTVAITKVDEETAHFADALQTVLHDMEPDVAVVQIAFDADVAALEPRSDR
jgi:probable selenium-dependent hydroxylase accessory protein YqeC